MAQRVRSRFAIAAALAVAGCSGEQQASPTPRAVDTQKVADDALVAAVLAECHAPLRGRMERVTAVVTLPDGAEYQLFAQLPDRLRAQTPSDRLLLAEGRVVRIEGDAPVAPADAARVQALRTLLDAAAFGPLHRATGCRRIGPSAWALAQPGGGDVTLALRDGTLLPSVFTIGGEAVRIVDYVPQPATWVARTVEHAALGACRVRFDTTPAAWTDDFFRVPAAKANEGQRRINAPGASREKRSPTPVTMDDKGCSWVVLADPGDWRGRAQAYAPVHAELVRQNQSIAGFTRYWRDGDAKWLAIGFRARAGGAAFVPPAGWQVRDIAAGRWLEVFPPAGKLDERVAAGELLLQDALRAQGVAAQGPITAQPYVHLDAGEPAAAMLEAPVVRMSVRLP